MFDITNLNNSFSKDNKLIQNSTVMSARMLINDMHIQSPGKGACA